MCNHPKARILYDETKLLEGLPHLSEAWDAESEKIVPYLHPVRGFKRTLDFHVQRKDLTPTNVVATTTAAGSASGAVAGRAAESNPTGGWGGARSTGTQRGRPTRGTPAGETQATIRHQATHSGFPCG